MINTELFDQYLYDELPAEEKEGFESRLKEDREFREEFLIYLTTVKGICREAEQNNKDFGEAMKRISKDELRSIIGARKRDFRAFEGRFGIEEGTVCASTSICYEEAFETSAASEPVKKSQKEVPISISYDDSFETSAASEPVKKSHKEVEKPSRFRKWLLWQAVGVAALLGLGVIYVVIVRNELDSTRKNAIAMNQEAMNKVDNAIYTLSDYWRGVPRGGDDFLALSDEDLAARLPSLETTYGGLTEDTDIIEFGSDLVMVYIRLHEREKAKALLTELITRYQNNVEYEDVVINWETILSLLK